MRKQKYVHPVSIYLQEESFQKVKTITDKKEISICEWIRNAVDDALNNSENERNEI